MTWVGWKFSYRRVFHPKMLIRLNWNVPWKGFDSVKAFSGNKASLARAVWWVSLPPLLPTHPSAYLSPDFLALWLQAFPADWLVEIETPVRYQLSQLSPCTGAALWPDALWLPELDVLFLKYLLIPLPWFFIPLKLPMFYFAIQFRVTVIIVVSSVCFVQQKVVSIHLCW